MKCREQTKPNALDEDQCEVQRSEEDDGDHDVLHPNVKLASLKEQALVYGAIPDDDPTDHHDVDLGQGILEELEDAIEGFITSAEQAGMSRDGVQSLRQLVTECKDVFRLKLGADPPAWRLPDSVQRCRRGLGCDQMMCLFSLAMLLTLKGYILFRTSKL
jgi:hypothetical protein